MTIQQERICTSRGKRYILLMGLGFYPRAWKDFRGSFSSISGAQDALTWLRIDFGSGFPMPYDPEHNWFQIIDKETDKVVQQGGTIFGGLVNGHAPKQP